MASGDVANQSASGAPNMTTFAIPLHGDRVERIRELTRKLTDKHSRNQFSQRARAVGYTRESHHLQTLPDNTVLMLVHLEYDGDFQSLQRRLQNYTSNDDFDDWWTKEYISICRGDGHEQGKGLGLTEIETLFTWSTGETSS